MGRIVRAILLVLGFLLTQLITWALCLTATYALSVSRQTVTVEDKIPEAFPIVVLWRDLPLTPHSAVALLYQDVPSFRASHSNSTFLVPEDDEERLRELVARTSEPGAVRATFQVEREANGIQTLRVDAFEGSDLHNTAWYEARQDSIVALRHRRYFGPSLGLAAVLIATPLSLVLNAAAWIVARSRRRRRRGAEADAQQGGNSGEGTGVGRGGS